MKKYNNSRDDEGSKEEESEEEKEESDEDREESEEDKEESEEDKEESEEDKEESEDERKRKERVKRKKSEKKVKAGKKVSNKKRKKRKPFSSFLDIEAQVGDEDEEDEEDLIGFGDESNEAEIARRAIETEMKKKQALKRSEEERWSDTHIGGTAHLENAIDKIARKYQEIEQQANERFERGGPPLYDEEDDDYLDDTEPIDYDQQGEPGALLPDISDPKLWMVKVSRGGVVDIERTLAIAIEKKFFATGAKASDFGIQSVYAADHLKGYIYVEAESQFKIKEALRGLRHINLAGEFKMVPIREMPSVFNVRSKDKYIPHRGDFVRVKRGIYAGDLGQIYEVDDQEVYVTLRLVPRIDINAVLDKEQGITGGASTNGGSSLQTSGSPMESSGGGCGTVSYSSSGMLFTRKKVRPIKKFFDRDEVDARGGTIEQGPYPGTVRFASMIFEDSGHLLRRANINHLQTGEDVNADLSEIKEFKPRPDNEENDELNSSRMWLSVKKSLSMYKVGEKVEITKGDLTGVTGSIIRVADNEITIKTNLPHEKTVIIPQDHVMKKFSIGESVRALKGVNKGDTGLITHIDPEKKCASVFAFFSKRMFTCLLECLTIAPEDGLGMGGLGSINGFKLGDLVQLSTGGVGVLCFIDKNRYVRILLNDGSATNVDVSNIACKRSSFDVYAKDCNKMKVGCRSNVLIVEGLNKGKAGRVMHIWRSALFIKIHTKLEDGGFVVTNSHFCKLVGTESSFNNFTSANSMLTNNNESHSFESTNNSSSNRNHTNPRGRGRNYSFGGGGSRTKHDEFMGKIVKIVRGKYKGLVATIRRIEANNYVQLLLQCRPQEIKVQKSDLQIFETTADYIEHYPGTKASLFTNPEKDNRSQHSFFSPPNTFNKDYLNSNNNDQTINHDYFSYNANIE